MLCTQVLPLACAVCVPPPTSSHSTSSSESLATRIHEPPETSSSSHPPSLRQTDTSLTASTDFSGASTAVDSEPTSPSIERHPLFKDGVQRDGFGPQFRYGRAQGETCSSCSFSVPRDIAEQLPQGAPGCVKPDGKINNGAPVLRSREFVCLLSGQRNRHEVDRQSDTGTSHDSKASLSWQSQVSSHFDCHDHILTYLSAKSPDDPEQYSRLRASVVRTITCEQMPRGKSDGPFCFGDSEAGYTIAYSFRLPDPQARGKKRAYALVALAGKDTSRAFRACPMVWEAFATLAQAIELAARRHQDEQERKHEEEPISANTREYTPASSFLTQRANDPDGYPRRAKQTVPQSLAEIIGDPNIFPVLHQYFVALLRCLGDRFGGLPLVAASSVYQTLADEAGLTQGAIPSHVHTKMVDKLIKVCVDDKTPVPELRQVEEMESTKGKVTKSLKRNSQCAPLAARITAQRQVVV